MKKIVRYNIRNHEIEHEYEIREGEKVIQLENAIYIVTENELNQYLNGEIEPFEFNDAPYELEKNELFIIC